VTSATAPRTSRARGPCTGRAKRSRAGSCAATEETTRGATAGDRSSRTRPVTTVCWTATRRTRRLGAAVSGGTSETSCAGARRANEGSRGRPASHEGSAEGRTRGADGSTSSADPKLRARLATTRLTVIGMSAARASCCPRLEERPAYPSDGSRPSSDHPRCSEHQANRYAGPRRGRRARDARPRRPRRRHHRRCRSARASHGPSWLGSGQRATGRAHSRRSAQVTETSTTAEEAR
jgi:hypothetical protein